MKIGFIGMGNMAKAIAAGFIGKELVDAMDVSAYAPTQDKLMANADELGFMAMASPNTVVQISDVVILACKPYQIKDVLPKLVLDLKGKVLLSVCAGWTFDNFENIVKGARIQCIMPNTPAMVGEGIYLFEEKNSLEENERKEIMELFSHLGSVEELPTHLMGIGGAISGCGPAFMDMIMESYADAAVKYGIKRDMAYRLIGGTMLGSAKLMLETGKHPGVLKDEVCSPSGTTICGVAALEKNGLRNACIESIDAIMNKKSLG